MRAPCISTEPERWGARYMASASSFGGPMGTMLWGFSAETLLSLCSPLSSALAVLWRCLSRSQDLSGRRHEKGISTPWALCSQLLARREVTAGSAPERGFFAVLLFLGRPREMCPVCGLPHQSQLLRTSVTRAWPQVLRPAATSQQADFTSTFLLVLCLLPDAGPTSPSA